MLDSLPADLDQSEGSFIWDAVSPTAIELALAAIQAQEVLRRGFAGTTFGAYLDLRCEEHGVTRKGAIKASGQVKFTGTSGVVVPSGTRVGTATDMVHATASIAFETIGDVTLDNLGIGLAPIIAVDGGTAGNVPSGGISLVLTPVAGVTGVVNVLLTAGGVDIENDASLLSRYYAKVRSPGTSGNKADYLNWALEVSGVGGAQVLPLWNGPGTVKVVLIGSDKRGASAEVVAAVQQYIYPEPPAAGKAPIGADVAVVAASEINVSISAQLTLNGTRTLAQVKDDFIADVQSYLADLAFASDPTVRFVRIGSLLLDTQGVQDYVNLQMNAGTSNVTIAQDQAAVLGTVTFT